MTLSSSRKKLSGNHTQLFLTMPEKTSISTDGYRLSYRASKRVTLQIKVLNQLAILLTKTVNNQEAANQTSRLTSTLVNLNKTTTRTLATRKTTKPRKLWRNCLQSTSSSSKSKTQRSSKKRSRSCTRTCSKTLTST